MSGLKKNSRILYLNKYIGRLSHPHLYARIPRNRQKVRQFGVLFPIPMLDIFSLSYLTVGIGIPTLIHSIYYSSYI